jgi:hypothetical protein
MFGDENSTTSFLYASLPVEEGKTEPYELFLSNTYGSRKRGTVSSFKKKRKCTPSGRGGSKRLWSVGNCS